MRGAERILLSRHQVRRDGAGVEISFLEDRFVAQMTVEAEANAEIPVPVAACALSLLEILVRVARDGHERTLGVNTFGEQLVRSDVVAADLNRLQNEKSFQMSNVRRFSHIFVTSWLLRSAIRVEVDMSNLLLQPETSVHEIRDVRVNHVDVFGVGLVQPDDRVRVLKEKRQNRSSTHEIPTHSEKRLRWI